MIKLKYKTCLESLNKILGFKPSHSDISKVIGVSANALSNRLSCDGYLKEDEILKIEKYWDVSLRCLDDYVNIDYYPFEFGVCKDNVFVFSKNKEMLSISRKCFNNFSPDKNYSIINAVGDTMSPYIKDNDKLIVEHYNGGQIRDNSVYVFCFNDEIFTKRLINNIDQIVVKSDNEIYPMRFINSNERKSFFIIGQIIGLLRDLKN